MPVISDTSPISSLAIIGRLSLLRSQFSEICIPPAVLQELMDHPNRKALGAIETAIQDRWIRMIAPAPSRLLSVLLVHLHSGEAEAIALAAELNADMVIIDEQEGRQFAMQAGLRVTGVLGILLRAKKSGDLIALKPEIQSLRTKARFFVASSLETRILQIAEEA